MKGVSCAYPSIAGKAMTGPNLGLPDARVSRKGIFCRPDLGG